MTKPGLPSKELRNLQMREPVMCLTGGTLWRQISSAKWPLESHLECSNRARLAVLKLHSRTNANTQVAQKSEFIQMFEKFAPIGILRSELPTIYRMICLAPKRIFDINETEKIIIRNGKEILARARTGSIDRTNIFTSHLEADESRTNSISKESMVVEATGLVGAGGGTTSVTLTYLVWAVLQQPLVQKKLEEEVATLPDDFAASDLEALPYLNAVLEETLRLHGPIPGALPRVIPASGLSIAGYFIPQGSTVCTQAYSMHRQPEIFPDPERYIPPHVRPLVISTRLQANTDQI